MNVRKLKITAMILGGVIILLLIVLVVGLVLRARGVLDGDGMVYDFRTQDLGGSWAEIGADGTLRFDNKQMHYAVEGKTGSADYALFDTGRPADGAEVEIELRGREPFEYLLWHRETVGGETVGVISGIVMERDGRGPVCYNEFVRTEDLRLIPDGWQSAVARRLNAW